MPSTTTTTITIGTILDLIGPTTSSPAASDGQSGFDSLLQAPQAPPSTPLTSSADDSRPPPTGDSRRTDHDYPAPENHPATDSQDGNSPSQDYASSQSSTKPTPASAAPTPDKTSADHEEPDHSSDKTEDQLATEQIIAQSLAGLPTAPKNVPPPTTAEADTSVNDKEAVGEAKSSNAQTANIASQVKAGNPEPNDSAADAQVQASNGTDDHAQKTSTNPVKSAAATADSAGQETVAKLQAGDKVEAVKNGGQDQANDESQQSSEIKLTTDDKLETQPTQTKHDQSPTADTSQLTLDTSAIATQSPDGASAQGATATPLVAPAASILPAVDQPGPTQANNSNTAGAIGSTPPRGRLPAQALAPAANVATRHAPVDIDSARLIGRVVRAFSAAQDRDGEVHLRLSPPELGSLRLDVRVENGALTAHLQTETDSARLAIIDNLPALRDRLAEQGVRIERFDVDLMQRQPGGMPDQPGGRQPDTPEAPLRFNQSPPTAAVQPAAVSTTPSAVIGNAGGLNVIV